MLPVRFLVNGRILVVKFLEESKFIQGVFLTAWGKGVSTSNSRVVQGSTVPSGWIGKNSAICPLLTHNGKERTGLT